MDLEQARHRLSEIDDRILKLAAERQKLVGLIGSAKLETNRGTRDYDREKQVLERARQTAYRLGLSTRFAEDLSRLLIRNSLSAQEAHRVSLQGSGRGQRGLIIGGAGQMGGWFARFLDSQGYLIEIADPRPADSPFPQVRHFRDTDLRHDLIIVAATLRSSGTILRELARAKPSGIIMDIGSLKSPLRDGFAALLAAGCLVTSIHPMFGPDTDLLSGRHVIFVDVGCQAATERARELFASTMATQVEMNLDDHDHAIAYVLGLSHALNIAFFSALATSGEAAPVLAKMSSTTFDAQLKISAAVAAENPHMYFEIQSLNHHRNAPLDALAAAVDVIRRTVRDGDETHFVELMEQGRQYLQDRPRDNVL